MDVLSETRRLNHYYVHGSSRMHIRNHTWAKYFLITFNISIMKNLVDNILKTGFLCSMELIPIHPFSIFTENLSHFFFAHITLRAPSSSLFAVNVHKIAEHLECLLLTSVNGTWPKKEKRIDLFICLPKTERRCLFILLLQFYSIRREYVESIVRHLFSHVKVHAFYIFSVTCGGHTNIQEIITMRSYFVHQSVIYT